MSGRQAQDIASQQHRDVSAAGQPGPLLDDAPCGFIRFADDGAIRAVNRTLLDRLGFTRDEMLGRHVESLFNVGTRIFYQTHFFPLLRLHGHAEEIFLLLRPRTGEDIGVLANAVRRDAGGEFLTDCVLIEVHERRKFEEALLRAKKAAETAQQAAEAHRAEVEAANDQLESQAIELELSQQTLREQAEELERQKAIAEEANRAKSAFLAVMSHELRTPLNAIGGYVQLIELGIHGPVTEAQVEALSRIRKSQRHLLRLIEDVLNLARIESGRLEYHFESVALDEIVATTIPMIEPQIAKRRLRYEADVPPGLTVYADREKVQQILLNLLSNAVKFTPENGTIRVEAAADAERQEMVRLRVIDTGIGIPASRLGAIFEPFTQVDASHTRSAEGTGLGLSISRDLARGMTGDLTASSEIGKGSTFTLLLPQRAPEATGSAG